MTENQANEIQRVVSELSDKDLAAFIKEMYVADTTGYFDPGGWIDYLRQQICVIIGLDVKMSQSFETIIRLLVYKEAAKRFAEQQEQK